MHIAETREEARSEVVRGLPQWIHYLTKVSALGIVPDDANSPDEFLDALVGGGFAVIGTPDDAAIQIERLQEASGGFGKLLLWHHDWARWDTTIRSYRLFATEVAPRFQGTLPRLAEAEEFVKMNRDELYKKAMDARNQAQEDYEREKQENRRPKELRARESSLR